MPITIMIVDDDVIIRKLIRLMLKGSEDIIFLEAKNTTEALKIAREHLGLIDLLISDVMVPGGMNGAEMAAQLSHTRPQTKICLMSGYSSEQLKTLTMEPHWHFIQKPFAVNEIRERVGKILADNCFVAQ